MITAGYKIRRKANGNWEFTHDGFGVDGWMDIRSPLHLLAYVLGKHYDKYKGKPASYIFADLNMHASSICRIGKGQYPIPYDWPLRVYDAVGMPIDECRRLLAIDMKIEDVRFKIPPHCKESTIGRRRAAEACTPSGMDCV